MHWTGHQQRLLPGSRSITRTPAAITRTPAAPATWVKVDNSNARTPKIWFPAPIQEQAKKNWQRTPANFWLFFGGA